MLTFDDVRVTFNSEGQRRLAFRDGASITSPIQVSRNLPTTGEFPEVALSVDVPAGQSGEQAGAILETGGAFTLRKSGDGTFTLGATNSYSGGTEVLAGTLLVHGSSGSGPVTVSSGAGVGGTGTVGGNLSVASGATVAPGASAGTLTAARSLLLAGGPWSSRRAGSEGGKKGVD